MGARLTWVLLYLQISDRLTDCVDVITADRRDTIVFVDSLLQVNGMRITYSDADRYCAANGGHLPKITDDKYLDIRITRLVWQTSNSRPPTCLWLGMSDRGIEGDWRWYDGSPVRNIKWWDKGWLYSAKKNIWHCGLLCFGNHFRPDWKWGWADCKVKFASACQYDFPPPDIKTSTVSIRATSALTLPFSTVDLVADGISTTTQPKSGTLQPKAPIRKHRKAKKKTQVVVKMENDVYLTGTVVLEKYVPLVTMCARVCQKKCCFLNYNVKTGHCRGFRHSDAIETKRPADDWQLWKNRAC